MLIREEEICEENSDPIAEGKAVTVGETFMMQNPNVWTNYLAYDESKAKPSTTKAPSGKDKKK